MNCSHVTSVIYSFFCSKYARTRHSGYDETSISLASAGNSEEIVASNSSLTSVFPAEVKCKPSMRDSFRSVSLIELKWECKSSTGTFAIAACSTHAAAYTPACSFDRSRTPSCMDCRKLSRTAGGVISTKFVRGVFARSLSMIVSRLALYSSTGTCWCAASPSTNAASFAPSHTVMSVGVGSTSRSCSMRGSTCWIYHLHSASSH